MEKLTNAQSTNANYSTNVKKHRVVTHSGSNKSPQISAKDVNIVVPHITQVSP